MSIWPEIIATPLFITIIPFSLVKLPVFIIYPSTSLRMTITMVPSYFPNSPGIFLDSILKQPLVTELSCWLLPQWGQKRKSSDTGFPQKGQNAILPSLVQFNYHIIPTNHITGWEMHTEKAYTSLSIIHKPISLSLRKPLLETSDVIKPHSTGFVMCSKNASYFCHNY